MSLSGHGWGFYFSGPGVASMFSRIRIFAFSGWRSLLCLSSGGSLADLPGYPYPAYYGPLSIPRPRTAVPRHLLSRAAGLWTQTNATPGRGLFRTSAPQRTLLINSLLFLLNILLFTAAKIQNCFECSNGGWKIKKKNKLRYCDFLYICSRNKCGKML